MPANQVMNEFESGNLHSGTGKLGKKGKIVTNPHQAKAILLSELRKEGHNIPKKSPVKRYGGK